MSQSCHACGALYDAELGHQICRVCGDASRERERLAASNWTLSGLLKKLRTDTEVKKSLVRSVPMRHGHSGIVKKLQWVGNMFVPSIFRKAVPSEIEPSEQANSCGSTSRNVTVAVETGPTHQPEKEIGGQIVGASAVWQRHTENVLPQPTLLAITSDEDTNSPLISGGSSTSQSKAVESRSVRSLLDEQIRPAAPPAAVAEEVSDEVSEETSPDAPSGIPLSTLEPENSECATSFDEGPSEELPTPQPNLTTVDLHAPQGQEPIASADVQGAESSEQQFDFRAAPACWGRLEAFAETHVRQGRSSQAGRRLGLGEPVALGRITRSERRRFERQEPIVFPPTRNEQWASRARAAEAQGSQTVGRPWRSSGTEQTTPSVSLSQHHRRHGRHHG